MPFVFIAQQHLTKLSVLKLEKARASSLLRLNDILRERKLPNLTELSVKGSSYEHKPKLDSFLDELDPDQTGKLAKVSLENFIISSQGLKLFCQKLPYLQLHELNLSNSQNMKGSLSMFTHSFPTLNTLILRSCDLNSSDLQSLARANVEGKLPQLRHLDISWNNDVEIRDLFTRSAQWNQLTTPGTADLSVLNIELI